MRIILSFLMLVILNSQAFACSLCYSSVPTAHVFLEFESKDNNVTNINIEWIFSSNFTNLTKQNYDLNANLKLEDSEIETINKAFLDYVKEMEFLMSFEFYDMPNGQTIKLDGEIKDAKTEILDDKLVFKFSKSLNLELTSSRVIKVSANDPGGYFKFRFLNSGNKNITDSFFVSYNSNLNSLFVTLEKGQAKASRQNTLSSALEEIEKEQKIGFIERKTINSLENLKALFVSSANGLNFALAMSIVTISFVYGFFHAAGPGHAKVLTTSYFMANGGNYLKSLWFALKLGFFHVLGSFLLVVVSMFVIDIVADFLAVNSMVLTTKISAIMIIFVAIFMFIDKVKSMGKHEHKCGCCKKENEWFIALSAAIIPCPGTILVFLLAFNVGSYFIALISAVFMGLGMTSVIFLAAVFGSKINKLTSKKFKYVKSYVEFLGIWLMLAIGVFMFMISDKLGIL